MTKEEFDAMLTDNYEELILWCTGLTGDSDTARDLAHDTIERALTRVNLYRTGNGRAWLFTIAKRLFINHIRHDRMIYCDPTTEDGYGVEARDMGVDGNEDGDYATYLEAMGMLSDIHREVFQLRDMGMTMQEIANKLDIPLGTVKSRLFYAGKQIRGALHG